MNIIDAIKSGKWFTRKDLTFYFKVSAENRFMFDKKYKEGKCDAAVTGLITLNAEDIPADDWEVKDERD